MAAGNTVEQRSPGLFPRSIAVRDRARKVPADGQNRLFRHERRSQRSPRVRIVPAFPCCRRLAASVFARSGGGTRFPFYPFHLKNIREEQTVPSAAHPEQPDETHARPLRSQCRFRLRRVLTHPYENAFGYLGRLLLSPAANRERVQKNGSGTRFSAGA